MDIWTSWNIYGLYKDDPDIYGFLPINSIIIHMTMHFLKWCVNGTEIHKYLGHPYTIHKCLNVVRMSIFHNIFLYIFPRNLYWTKRNGLNTFKEKKIDIS